MWRLVIFLALLAALAFGVAWLADQPGEITLAIPNLVTVRTSPFGAVGAVLATSVVISILWSLFRLVFRIPSIFNYARNARRRRKGYDAPAEAHRPKACALKRLVLPFRVRGFCDSDGHARR